MIRTSSWISRFKPRLLTTKNGLLAQARHYAEAEGHPLSAAVQQAFLATPRHRFVSHYRDWETGEWHVVTPATLAQHLAVLYGNHALGLFGDDEQMPSTISQPSLVLYMLDLLQLAPGQRVFEVGAGSGWNAALIGQLVAPTGHVYSVEIIPEMAQSAAQNVAALGLTNVTILTGDAGSGYTPGAPYDRAIFTAGATDLPTIFYEQLAPTALLLLVLKVTEGSDTLFLLRKTDNHFTSLQAMAVGFVPMTGAHSTPSIPQLLTDLSGWEHLQTQVSDRRAFWWGGQGEGRFYWRTRAIRAFLTIVEPWYQPFLVQTPQGKFREIFGLWDAASESLTLAYDDHLITYGAPTTNERLRYWLQRWIDFGMPAPANFHLQIYPTGTPITPGENEWLLQRSESQFLWRLSSET